jgi:hypothetical protein
LIRLFSAGRDRFGLTGRPCLRGADPAIGDRGNENHLPYISVET